MSNNLEAKKENLPSNEVFNPADYGIDSNDIQIPRLMLTQKMSKAIDEGKAKPGDLLDSLTGTVLGDEKRPLEFIAICQKKVWRVYEVENNERKQTAVVPYAPDNCNWSWEDVVDGKQIKRQLCYQWSVLLPSQVKTLEAIPYLLEFKSTSANAGKKLDTFITKLCMARKSPFSSTFLLSVRKEQNNQNTFYVFDVNQGRVTDENEQKETAKWFQIVGKKAPIESEEDGVPF